MAFTPDKAPSKGFTPDKPAGAAAPVDTSEHTFLGDLGHNALGALENAGAAVGNVPGAIVNAAADFGARATGHTGGAHPIPMIPVGQAGRDFGQQGADLLEQGLDKLGVGNAAASAAGATSSAAHNFTENNPALTNGLAAAGDALAVIPAAAALRSGVQGVTAAIRAAAARDSGPAAAAGFRNTSGLAGGTGRILAGDTAKPALVNHNANVGNVIGASEAGIPTGTAPSYEALEAARAEPGAVMDRVAAELPDNHTVDATGRAGITAAANPAGEGTVLAQGAQADVAAWRDRLLQPSTGAQRINQLRTLRQEGFTQAGSDAVDQQQIGAAKLGMARALEDNIGRDLPVGGSVDLDQFQAARKTLAKNYTWQSALRGNDFDLSAIARIQRAEPQLLDGATKTAADFANANREVVGLPTRVNAPSIPTDLANTNPLKLGNLASFATAGTGPALGRLMLRGGPSTLERTNRMFSAQPGRFAPLPSDVPPMPHGPPEPEFTTGVGANPNPPAAGGRPGDIPLADLLSHGVEQPPAAGLTAGPMGAPQPSGIPFQVNAGHAAGDLSLAHEPSLGDLLADLRDHAAVMSQGVPEGVMARTAAPGGRMASAGKPGMLANNASGESAASQEAINRGTRNLVQIDSDGNATPVLRDVTQVDARAPKGNLLMDADSGEIIDRGGLNQRNAEALRNRAASKLKLGDNFVSR